MGLNAELTAEGWVVSLDSYGSQLTPTQVAAGATGAAGVKADGTMVAPDGSAIAGGGGGAVTSVAGRTGDVTLTQADVAGAATQYDPLLTVAASGASTGGSIASTGVMDITLTANTTLTLSGAVTGQSWGVTLILRQDATGSRTVSWPSGTKWAGGAAPTLSTAANSVDIVSLFSVDGGTTWFGALGGKAFA